MSHTRAFNRVIGTAVVAVILMQTSVLSAAEGAPFGPSETGCPSFWAGGAPPPSTEPDSVAGPFGYASTRVTGFGLSTDGTNLQAVIRVRDMQEQVPPGYKQAHWKVEFNAPRPDGVRTITMTGLYDVTFDAFYYRATVVGVGSVPATGSPTMGPGGGLTVTASLEALQLESGALATGTRAYTQAVHTAFYPPPPDPGNPFISSGRTSMTGPASWPIVPCPGMQTIATDLGGGQGVTVGGYVLPAEEGQPIAVEAAAGDEWTVVASGVTEPGGRYLLTVPVPAGATVLRVRMSTRALGEVLSEPFTATAS